MALVYYEELQDDYSRISIMVANRVAGGVRCRDCNKYFDTDKEFKWQLDAHFTQEHEDIYAAINLAYPETTDVFFFIGLNTKEEKQQDIIETPPKTFGE